MIDTLKLFTTSSLFEATSALLAKLNIRFNRQTAEPINVADLYDGVMPQYLTNALRLVEHTYFIGVANDLSLDTGEKSDNTINEISEKIENGGRYDGMFLFACDAMADVHITRSDISALTRAFNRISYANPVILIIRQANLISLSTCERMTYTQEWRKNFGEKLGKVSILRDVDCQNPHRGHIDIINELVCSGCKTFDELYAKWNKLFNSEVLTKKFYKELFEWYQWAIAPETNVTFPGNADTPDDDREDIDTRVIRLITRLMFVWFIKQKNLVPKQIFEKDYLKSILKDFDPYSATQSSYYQGILQNLFFATLNRPILEDGETRAFATNNVKEVTNLYRYGSTDDDGGLFTITDDEVIDIFSTVPFLNCGLFECLDKTRMMDGVERRYYNDGFSRNIQKFKNGTYRYRAVVPNILFFHEEKGIISIFQRNIFTIEENTPQDVQVALDPELLGKVFENLLGAYNPETKETARNQSGSFYTPREIVQYMVNESLIAHLKRTVDENLESEYRKLLSFNEDELQLTDEQKVKIVHSIITCKVLDPACGSGAFPMGMLQQMVHVLQRVDPDNRLWRNQLENLAADDSRKAFGITDEDERNAKLNEIRETFNNALNSPDYTRKLYIIESCIYGSDIQPIAMLITRLRFFITLVCEQNDIKKDKPEENFGIKTLPNLESKFVAANTLLDADIHKYGQTIKYDEQLTKTKDELLAVRHKHFYTHKRKEKIKLLKQDEQIRAKLHTLINAEIAKPDEHRIFELEQRIAECENELPKYEMALMAEEAVQTDIFGNTDSVMIDKNKERRDSLKLTIRKCKSEIEKEKNKKIPLGFEKAVLQVTEWNPYEQNKVAPFLDLEWMFGITDGFDIVIGNPPYIQLQNDGGELAKLYEHCCYSTFVRTGDIYCLFYERGWKLLKDNGLLCFITSNKWMRAGYGEKTREFFAHRTNPILLIDFAGVKIFESATVDTNILLLSKSANEHKTICAVTNKQSKDSIRNLSVFVQRQNTVMDFHSADSWVILSPIEQSIKRKIEAVGTPLKDWNINIYRGVLTGCNEAFIIDTAKRDEILANCQSDEEREKTAELIRPILRGRDIKRYSYEWANLWLIYIPWHFPYQFDESIQGASEKAERAFEEQYPAVYSHMLQYQEPLSKRNKAETGIRYEWYAMQRWGAKYWEDFNKPKIIFQEIVQSSQFVYDETIHYMCNDTGRIIVGSHLPFVLGILNSKLFFYAVKKFYGGGILGEHGIRMKHTFFGNFPCLPYNKQIEDAVTELSKNRCTTDKIEALIFSSYALSKEEISVIEEDSM